jgi:hypothetical protein
MPWPHCCFIVPLKCSINDDAVGLSAFTLSLPAVLSSRRMIVPVPLAPVHVAKAAAPHVTDAEVVPYELITAAAARLDPTTGPGAASRWDNRKFVHDNARKMGREITNPCC